MVPILSPLKQEKVAIFCTLLLSLRLTLKGSQLKTQIHLCVLDSLLNYWTCTWTTKILMVHCTWTLKAVTKSIQLKYLIFNDILCEENKHNINKKQNKKKYSFGLVKQEWVILQNWPHFLKQSWTCVHPLHTDAVTESYLVTGSYLKALYWNFPRVCFRFHTIDVCVWEWQWRVLIGLDWGWCYSCDKSKSYIIAFNSSFVFNICIGKYVYSQMLVLEQQNTNHSIMSFWANDLISHFFSSPLLLPFLISFCLFEGSFFQGLTISCTMYMWTPCTLYM